MKKIKNVSQWLDISCTKFPDKLSFRQGTILREPFDHMGFIFKQQMITPLKVLRCWVCALKTHTMRVQCAQVG